MKNLIFLNRSGMGPDGTSRKGRYSLDPILSRLCLVSLICLCMLTVGVGNAWGVVNGDLFERISAVPSANDEVIFVNQASTYACGTTDNGNNRTPVSITTSSNQYIYNSSNNVQVFVVKTASSKYGFHTGSGYIYSKSSSKNQLGTNSTAASTAPSGTALWSMECSSNVWSVTNGTNTSYYLAFNGTDYFAQYKSGQSKPYIYKKVMSAPTAVAASSITSSGATITITDATNVNNYELYYSKSSTAPNAGTTASTTITSGKSKALTGLDASSTYYLWARAYSTSPARKTGWVALTGNYFTTSSAGTSVSYSKAATSNGSFTLSPASSVTTTSSAQNVTVSCTPNTGYYVSNVTATNPATGTATVTGSGNSWNVQYSSGANGSSTISVTFSPIWYLKGSFNTWGETNPCTVADGIATATVSLAKNTKYEFQFYDKQNSTWYYNGGNIVEDISGWTFTGGTGSNCKIFTGKAGTYTFKINTSTKAVQVIYQAPSHPDDAYVYFKKWADWSDNYFVHWWDGSGNTTVQDYNSAIRVTKTYSTCDNDYVCFPILADYTNFLVKDAASGDGSHKSGDLTSNSNAAKYYDFESWKNFTTYEINFGGNGNTGGEMSSITDLCPGAEQALTSNAFTKTHYSFSCWHADVAVKVGESTISAGGDISNGATIKDIQSNINLTAQWSPVSYTITKTFTNVANAGLPASFTYTGATTTALNSSFTVDGTNFFLPSSITVTMGGTPLTKDTHYTYNNSTGAFTFDVAITGNIVITATAVPKLKSIAITSQPTTRKYLVGDVFSSTGAVVTATMGDGNTKTVSATWTPSSALSAGTGQTVTASYTENGINQTATTTIDVYTVTVNKVNMSGVEITNASVTATCSGRTLSQSVGSTNYKFNSWNVTAGGVTVSTNTITGTPTGNVTINAKFHDPITVTWKVGSGAASGGTGEVKYGTAITALPSTPADNALASCGTNKFMGWSKSELKGTGHDAPADLFTTVGGATALTENTTYRAVFASSTSGAAANTVLFSENWTGVTASTTPSSPSASGSSVYGSATITYTWTDGTTTTQTYTDGGPNSNENILISKSNGAWKASGIKTGNASKIVFTYAKSGSGTVSVSSPTSNVSVGGSSSGSYITFTGEVSTFDLEFKNTNGSNNLRLDDIVVKVYTAGTTAEDYQTGCCETPASALSITSANSVATGGTVSLTSTGGNGGTVTWSVVNGTGTATVAGSTLTAGNVGTVTVKAHQDANTVLGTEYCAQDAEQAFTVVSSTVNVTGVEVSPTSKAIVPGETFDITPTISPSNATDKSVSWTSSASDKASVSSGTVTGVAAGTATITCTTTDGSYTATCAVTVRDVTLQARDEDGNTIAAGGPGAPSRSGATITAAANAGNYVFKQWQVTNASVASTTTTPTTISNPTGAVTVTAVYYKPRVVKWSVNGNDSYTAGGATTAVAYNGTISTVPTNPSGLACAGTFVAWTDAAHNNGQTAKDDDSYYESKLFTDAGDFPNITAETTTFYAVFAEQSNSDGYKYIGDDGTLTDGKKYIFVSSKSAGSAYALKATDLAAPNSGNNGTAVSVTVTSNAEGVLVTTVNTALEFEYVSSGTKLKYEVDGPATRYLFINGDGVGMKSDDSRSRYTTDAGLQGWNNKVTTYYDVYYNSTNEKFEKKESADSRVYAFIKQTPTYSNYRTQCDPNIVKVTYNANGGSTTCADGSHDKRNDYTVCSSAPTRDYYTFAGWLCSADSKTYAASATIPAAAIDADFTLTAQWTPVPYSITYELYGGTNSGSNPATYNVTTATITLQDPTKGHDRFEGWYSTYSAGVYSDQVTSIPLGSHGAITLHAKWTARHEIIFDADGATTTIYRADDEDLSASVAGQGSVPSDPSAPTACSSKVFVGWSESTIDGETDTEPGDLMKPAAGTVDEDKHYYAVWATESSESGQVKVFEDTFYGKAADNTAVSSYGKWTLSTVFGTGTSSEGVRLSSGSYGASMTLDLSDKTLESTLTIKFKIKKYSSKSDGTVEFDCLDAGATPTFTPSSFNDPTASWVEKTCTVTGVDNKVKSITINGITDKQVLFKDFVITQTGTVYNYSAYSTSCCATKIVLSDPSITDASSSGSTITFDKSSPVYTCGGTKTVTATLTLIAGYQASALSFAVNSGTVSISPAISTPITSSQVYTLTFAEDQNATLTTTATIAAKPLNGITITPSSGEVYVGQYVDFTVSYDPADYLSPGYTLKATPVYVAKEAAAPANTKLRLKGGRASGPGASITETVNETVTIQASGDNTKTASVNMTVNPLPRVHFEDLVHGKEFADVVATIVENALNPNKTTKTSVDWVTPNANDCEENHLHLVGWIREDWPALVAYLNGTGDAPTTTAIVGAGNDGAGHAYYIAAGASINVQTFDGVTFYAVWAEIK